MINIYCSEKPLLLLCSTTRRVRAIFAAAVCRFGAKTKCCSVKGNHGLSVCCMGLHASVVSVSVKTCFCYKESNEFQKKTGFFPNEFQLLKVLLNDQISWKLIFLSFQIRKPVWHWLDLQVSIFLLWGMLAHFCSSLLLGLALQKKDTFP